MLNLRSILYKSAKLLAQQLNIDPPQWNRSNIQSLQRFIRLNYARLLPFLEEIRQRRIRGVSQFKFTNQTVNELRLTIVNLMEPNSNYYFAILDEYGIPFNIRRAGRMNLNSTENPFYNLHTMLTIIMNRHDEYNVSNNYLIVQMHKQVNDNQPLRNQRDGEINCACQVVLDHLNKYPDKNTKKKKEKIMKINDKYLTTGIDDEGLQELSNKSLIQLIIQDKIGASWREFKPKAKGNYKKLLLVSHNNHISHVYDSDDIEEPSYDVFQGIEVKEFDNGQNTNHRDLPIKWFDSFDQVIERANKYENDGNEGTPIISKGNLVAYICDDVIWKTKFYQHELYPNCFTSGGVGQSKFINQMNKQGLDHYKYGINDTDSFWKLLMDADKSGFYSRTGPSSREHIKYDQNKSYKSFSHSNLFNGFPILEAIFKIDTLFSESNELEGHGLLYVECERLTPDKLNQKIYYEASGWYPIEIIREYYNKHNINPFIKSYAYASQTFNVNFHEFTNDQFRTFLGKCVSKSFDEVWRTNDYLEFMRARYILRDRITSFNFDGEFYQIVYASDKKPWNMPVLSVYIKSHQKYNLFQQYNKLIDQNIIPVAVSVDGIEVKEKCDELFSIGSGMGQWKHEDIYTGGNSEPFVIKRDIPKLEEQKGQEPYTKKLILSKYLHISGAGGNGKSNMIIELARAYPDMVYLAPTNDAVKNLVDRAKELNITIQAYTYHRAFGFGCADVFPRNKYRRFVLDECSMLSADNLKIIMKKLNSTQSLLIAGDFCQLPCIDDTPIYDNWTGKKSEEYEKFEIRELTKNWRQKEDPEFFSLCNKLRCKLSTEEAKEILNVLNSRVTKTLPKSDTLDDIHICGINVQVDIINKKHNFEVGKKVICNMTCVDKEKKTVANGSIGVVVATTPDNKDIKIQWVSGEISTFKGMGRTKSKKPRFTPCYALTIHKAQGKTIKRNVIINPSRLFAKNHLYVALTRATKFSSIFLTEKMTFETFCKTVYVKNITNLTSKPHARLERMLNTYINEEPKLTLDILQDMREKQKNKCCYCGVAMAELFGNPNSITLERVDDSKRHILSNIKFACFDCNSIHRK
jgi:hypothetical protein